MFSLGAGFGGIEFAKADEPMLIGCDVADALEYERASPPASPRPPARVPWPGRTPVLRPRGPAGGRPSAGACGLQPSCRLDAHRALAVA
jgi:hypothetical protein